MAKCLFKCDKCGKAFQTEEHLGTHKTKAKSRPYCCALCCIGFWSENQLQQHLAWHDEPLKANVPSADTRGTSCSSENQSQKSHKCQHCGKAFLSPTALQKHETQHCNNDSYHCSICPRTFSEIQDLIDHHQECIGDYKRQNDAPAAVSSDSISCEECGLKFTQWDIYQTHLHQHALEEERRREEEEEEEEEENQMGDDMSPVSELDSVYTYLVSYQKHLQLHENLPPTTKRPPSVPNLHQHHCPDCGMSFIRRARLLGHMRVHRPTKSKPPRCDQCSIDFRSIKSWMNHVVLHRKKPFWCLSCAKGFKNEDSLDKHMRSHTLMKHTCHICHESFHVSKQLRIHYKTHSGAKPYQCTFCGATFFKRGNLLLHRKKHLRAYAGFNGMLRGSKKRINNWRNNFLASVKEEPEMDTYVEQNETQQPCESGDHGSSEESDCGEPLHHFKLSKPPGSARSGPHDKWKSEPVQPLTGQELAESESPENNMYREHKYWEWECVECDMGFDEVAKLHLHYVKHATGELPIPHDDVDDI
ncbi:hypothetical protein F7725_018654 [Dissostichus mawsoni]|uniref:C2H2-type domain-containing protein n=1 Tax=Dissostichus mawsoni TaxID=36200 RepID=A0A7J5XTM9_DISMA|nr:hypothetical protein F7725_018654 [Dissostichus mawsoni]